MNGPKSEVVRLRVSSAMLAAIPAERGRRSAFLRKAVAHFIATRQGDKQMPIPKDADLQALQWLVRELNKIGVNLNQATMMLHLAERGEELPPTPEEMRLLHRQIASMARRIERVVRYWCCE